ncbi:MAG TPA: DUF4099 domain-containing protein [Mucilaginibacter sp.]|jgi:hypothetical protein
MRHQLYDEQRLPFEDLEKVGLAKDGKLNLDNDDLQALLSGRRTSMLRLENLFSDGLQIPHLDAKLSLKPNTNGSLDLLVHPIYRVAEAPNFLTADETLAPEKGEVPNVDRTYFDDKGDLRDVLVEFDKETNEFIVIGQERILVPDRVNGEYLTFEQKERYRRGKKVELPDGTTIQYSATDKNGVRSNKLALIASILIDGGLSFALYHGLNHLFGEKKHSEDADVYPKGYYADLEQLEEQERQRENFIQPENQYSRSYTRTGSR